MKNKIRIQCTSRLQIGKTQVKIRTEENRDKILQRESVFRLAKTKLFCVQNKKLLNIN